MNKKQPLPIKLKGEVHYSYFGFVSKPIKK